MAFEPFHDYLGLAGLVRTFVGRHQSEPEKPVQLSFDPSLRPFPIWSSADTSRIIRRPSNPMKAHSTGSVSSGSASDEESNNLSISPPSSFLQPFNLDTIRNMSKVYNEQNQKKLLRKRQVSYCVFCKNNDEEPEVYNSHTCKSPDGTITTCPILRAYTCPVCGAKNDNAHTLKYCPYNTDLDPAVTGFIAGFGTSGASA